ncbi:Phospholipid/glycerol acyltransferase [Arabidopsis thaliana x Arabidopsis arenosa]|uniref:Tafazzin family protein n=1 Tax=Arabidopsis thaliana x Arabidopsis arenosa TaxID=1240361 RepID=A0A8T2ASZ9_9BRAS|nr:Phospholipid/glycerol acyltransferase [Arabidopsis thaliana x Arabidopsis arenosa]KAG7576136.1 Phospholipid/glycerol acyltransferase [Arabidopsis thaliana x Arabidopsis arenosa]
MGIQFVDKADLWKSALLLNLKLRDRFRIAVDDHRGRAAVFSPDGYFSSTIHRWVTRFRNFRRESLPSPPAFYRRRVSKDLTAEEESALFRMLQAVAVPLIGNACHVFMNGFNRVQVYGLEKLHDALLNRPKNKPLVTVSNHVASVDDPFVIASLLPPKLLLDARNLRWTLCATDRCFKNPVTSAFFRSVKVLPVSRGEGIYQQGMDIAISKLNSGGWVHIFPEGSRSRDGGKTMGSAKRGIGRLILDADTLPMVVPFVHTGMQDIMPVGASVPRIGQTVTVIIGDPIHFNDILSTEGAKHVSRKHLYDAVSSRIGQRLYDLKVQVDRVSLEQQSMMSHDAKTSSDRAAEIFHRVDWDSFGMGAQFLEESSASSSKQIAQTDGGIVRSPKRRVSSEGGISLKIKKFMDSTEMMGFAARGLFMNEYKSRGESANVGQIRPLKVWREYLEVNLMNRGLQQQ